MEEGFTIFSRQQGCGYIYHDYQKMTDQIVPIPVEIAGETLHPDTDTTLLDFFSRPVLFLGVKDGNEAIFHIGSEKDLFQEKHYFEVVFIITPTRIFQLYAPGSGRDFNFINQKWK